MLAVKCAELLTVYESVTAVVVLLINTLREIKLKFLRFVLYFSSGKLAKTSEP